jgi:4-carboxymuconolactone decarboxylase
MAVAEAVFGERGIMLPEETPRDDSIETLDHRGRALLEAFHGERGYAGYASPDNPVTQALYPVAIQYGYGEIWHRPGLDRRQRALIAIASFTALRLDGQVRKFGQSALNAGLSETEIVETVIQTGPYSGLAPALNALAALSEALR